MISATAAGIGAVGVALAQHEQEWASSVVVGAVPIAEASPPPAKHLKYTASPDLSSGVRAHITKLQRVVKLDTPDAPPNDPSNSPASHANVAPARPSSASNPTSASPSAYTQLRTRVREYHTNTFSANDPIEDTYKVARDPLRFPGMLFGLFDGHSGSNASHFCRDHLYSFITHHYSDQITRNGWSSPFSPPFLCAEPFVAADNKFLDDAFKAKDVSGACVNVVHVNGDVVRSANLGDCRAVIGQRLTDHSGGGGTCTYRAVELSVDHDLKHNHDERRRLVREHPGEADIIKHYRVKGHLQPTRGIGDGVYKRMEFLAFRPSFMDKHKQWTPPYTSAVPVITSHVLKNGGTHKDEFLVLASDGLFQDLSSEDVVQYVAFWQQHAQPQPLHAHAHANAPPVPKVLQDVPAAQLQHDKEMSQGMNAASFLVYQALSAAARRTRRLAGSTEQTLLHDLFSLSGDRRRIHDDVTVVVVFFDEASQHGAARAEPGLVGKIRNLLVPKL